MPDEAWILRYIEGVARRLAELYGYEEVITPIIEHYELLAAKIGEENRKRMYVFEDLGGRKVALRPEFTASIARLVATKMAASPKPIRLFSFGSLYRYDEPQFGRYREFWQANYELIGSSRPEADAEILCLTIDFLKSLNIKEYTIKVNHIGILRGLLEREGVSEDDQNAVMQLLDKRDWEGALGLIRGFGVREECLEIMKKIIEIRGYNRDKVMDDVAKVLKDCPESISALNNLKEIIELVEYADARAKIFFEAGFARGLEYYTGIIFEVYVPGMDMAIGGGGRYDKLIGIFGGGDIPAVGVALGVDRFMLAMERQGASLPRLQRERVLVVPVSEELSTESIRIASFLREHGITSEVEVMGRSLSRALSDASRRNITHAIIVGLREIETGKVILRDMRSKRQEEVEINNLPSKIRSY